MKNHVIEIKQAIFLTRILCFIVLFKSLYFVLPKEAKQTRDWMVRQLPGILKHDYKESSPLNDLPRKVEK